MMSEFTSFMADTNSTGDFQSATSNEKDVKYKGVRKRKWGKWVSEIRLPNSRERIWLGSYNTAEKAARAFDVALFCLRGRNATFNFPDSPPVNIANGQSFTPDEIQAIASQYANAYEESQLQTTSKDEGETTADVSKMEDASASSSFGNIARMESMDWSFLEMLEPPHGADIAVRDYSLFSGLDVLHENMYMQPNMGSRNYDENNDDHDHGYNDGAVSYSQHSFLWNF